MGRSARLLLLAPAAAAAGLLLPGAAGATTLCTFGVIPTDPTPTLVVTHTEGDDELVLRVVRPATGAPVISVLEDGAAVACSGAAPAVNAVAVVRLSNAGGTSAATIEEPGAFGPGVAGINGDGRIKFLVTQGGGSLIRVDLTDTDGLAERWGTGSLGAASGIDVNPDAPFGQVDLVFQDPLDADVILSGSPQADVLGGPAPSLRPPFLRPLLIRAHDGDDTITGGSAADDINPGRGNDTVDGGDGFDDVDYTFSSAPIDIDLARPGPQNGGSEGADTLTAIEDVYGGDGNDVIRGDGAANRLDGGIGDDVIEGRAGNDFLRGGPGADAASYASATIPVTVDAALTEPQGTGGGGVDQFGEAFEGLVGGQAADTLRGTAGPDTIEGGPGGDTIRSLAGDDRLLLRDGAPDTADCGDGLDRAEVDPGGIDGLVGCEAVVVGVAPSLLPPGGAAGGGGTAGPHRVAARLAGSKTQRLVRGAVAVRVTCPLLSCGVRATAVATLKSGTRTRRVTLRAARARLAAGASATLRLTLPAAGRGIL